MRFWATGFSLDRWCITPRAPMECRDGIFKPRDSRQSFDTTVQVPLSPMVVLEAEDLPFVAVISVYGVPPTSENSSSVEIPHIRAVFIFPWLWLQQALTAPFRSPPLSCLLCRAPLEGLNQRSNERFASLDKSQRQLVFGACVRPDCKCNMDSARQDTEMMLIEMFAMAFVD
jgi:hypothetical protein